MTMLGYHVMNHSYYSLLLTSRKYMYSHTYKDVRILQVVLLQYVSAGNPGGFDGNEKFLFLQLSFCCLNLMDDQFYPAKFDISNTAINFIKQGNISSKACLTW